MLEVSRVDSIHKGIETLSAVSVNFGSSGTSVTHKPLLSGGSKDGT
jgi:hypothetical protein